MSTMPPPGPRVRCTLWTEADAPAYLTIYGDPEVCRFIGMTPMADLAEARTFIQKLQDEYWPAYPPGQGVWAIETDADGIVGTVMVKPPRGAPTDGSGEIEVGWHLRRDRWGHGYATEAAWQCLAYAFDGLGRDAIIALVDEDNTASSAIARRLHMQSEGMTERYYGMRLERFVMTRGRWQGDAVRRAHRDALARAAQSSV